MENEGLGAVDAAAAPVTEPGMLDRAIELFVAGGPVVAILLALSVFAVAIIVLKLWQFRTVRMGDRATARRALALYRTGERAEALNLAAQSRNPVAQVLAMAIRGRNRRDLPETTVREEIIRAGSEMLEALRSYFRALEVIATLSPLLGLFGTVLGMIDAFRQLEQAGNRINPAILSGGIWEALLTTAVGLAIAIPVVAVINWLERKVDGLAHEMDSVVTQVFTADLTAAAIEEEGYGAAGYRPAVVRAAE